MGNQIVCSLEQKVLVIPPESILILETRTTIQRTIPICRNGNDEITPIP